MIIIHRTSNSDLYYGKSSDVLLKVKIDTPIFQRDIIEEKVDQIVSEIKKNSLYIESYHPIILGLLNGNFYIIDGQHRLMAMKKCLEESMNINCLFRILKCNTMEELKQHFLSINNNTPLENFYKEIEGNKGNRKLEIKHAFKKLIESEFKEYCSAAAAPKIPNISIDKKLNEFFEYSKENGHDETLDQMTILDIVERFKITNKKIHDWFLNSNQRDFFIEKIQKKKSVLTFGFQTNWLDVYFNDSEPYKKSQKTNRKKFTKGERERIWRKYCPDNHSMDGHCYCCNGKITFVNFEVGHIVAVSKGGSNSMENLKPICSTCNRDMGTQNMKEFMSQMAK